MDFHKPEVVRLLMYAAALFSISSYGRMANDYSQGKISLAIDVTSIVGVTAFSICYTVVGFMHVARKGAQIYSIAFFGVIVLICVPLAFASIYLTFEQHSVCLTNDPNAFDVVYFSIVNFTTLGFGDITPIGVCRGVSALEAVAGYVFLGVFSALIVANLISRRN